jgi:hypothetical protein
MNQTIQPTLDARQDTLAAPAYLMIDALRRAIEASGSNIPVERVLTVTLYAATTQSAHQWQEGGR